VHGIVSIGSVDGFRVEEAKARILSIIDPPKADIGGVYMGRVVNITKFGAFVNILPGRDGPRAHLQLGNGKRINSVEDVLSLGRRDRSARRRDRRQGQGQPQPGLEPAGRARRRCRRARLALYDMTPTLNQVSRDLTLAALRDEIDPMIGREVELERTMQILCRRSKNNPALIGPAGVGKTAIAEGLALRIIEGMVPENLAGSRVVSLDAGLLSAGTKFRGDFEERLKSIMKEIVSCPGIIMVIDELHTLVRTGVAEGSLDAANLFKPMLARGEFQCIGATTLDEYRKTIEADAALERRFQPVMVEETNAEETMQILEGLRTRTKNSMCGYQRRGTRPPQYSCRHATSPIAFSLIKPST